MAASALTPRGERLLDALAGAGGVRQPADKITIQITRAGQVVALPLDSIIRDPRQNIRLQTDDVVAAIYQPYSFHLARPDRQQLPKFRSSRPG